LSKYCIDADVLIQAKNGPYQFKTWPIFWTWLESQIAKKTIFSSTLVYAEWIVGNDELANWAKDQKGSDFFIEPDDNTQIIYKDIADYVNVNYPERNAKTFLDGADAWVIAHAINEKASVVTQEIGVVVYSKKVKIPNVCKKFKVPCINLYDLFRKLNAKF